MSLPLTILLGIAIVLLQYELVDPLPGEFGWGTLWPTLPLWILPWLAARLLASRLNDAIAFRGQLRPIDDQVLRLPGFAVPVVYGISVLVGGLPQVAQGLARGSEFVQHALTLLPLIAIEISTRLAERRSERLLRSVGYAAGGIGPSRLPMSLFVLCPILLFSLITDVALLDPRLEAFFAGTTLGATTGMLTLVITLCLSLPLFFRFTMSTSARLPVPAQIAQDLRETAGALDFRGDCVLSMDTGLRVVNAAMVGPLPWPRYLVLSDGILQLLDVHSLRGVVAHEVGHAKAQHPAWLLLAFVIVPILLVSPMSLIDLESLSSLALACGAGIAFVLLVAGLRTIAHRFEFEADELSAAALGIAPCIAALRRVGELHPGHRDKASFRHPSERERVSHLQRWEVDPDYRAASRRRGLRLRGVILGGLVLAIGASAFLHHRSWNFDRASYSFYVGEFGDAKKRLESVQVNPPFVTEEDVQQLHRRVTAALELTIEKHFDVLGLEKFAEEAWKRAKGMLAAGPPSEAKTLLYLTLFGSATSHEQRNIQHTAWMLAVADEDEDTERCARLRQHLEQLDPNLEIADSADHR